MALNIPTEYLFFVYPDLTALLREVKFGSKLFANAYV